MEKQEKKELSSINKLLIFCGITLLIILCFQLFASTTGDSDAYQADEYELLGVAVTKGEYMQRKGYLIGRINSNRATWEEIAEWLSIVRRELETCNLSFENVTEENIIGKVNNSLNGCSH